MILIERQGYLKILRLDKNIAVVDDVYLLSKRMHGIEKLSSNPINQVLVDLSGLLNKHNIGWALCGGLAVGAYAKPRGTEDVDIVLSDDAIIDEVARIANPLFRHHRAHALSHRSFGVEVDLITPEFIKVSPSIVLRVIKTAKTFSLAGIKVPTVTKDGLVALKLGRASTQDVADIEAILKNQDVDLSGYELGEKESCLFEQIKAKVSSSINIKEEELL